MAWHRTILAGASAGVFATSFVHNRFLDKFRANADHVAPQPTLQRSGPQLKSVQVVFRHGARTPLTHYTDLAGDTQWDVCGQAYKAVQLELVRRDGSPAAENPDNLKQMQAILPGGCARGELTMVGQVQALHLGHWLRERYIEDLQFLPHLYHEGVVQSRTTNYSRTIATLRGVLTGLYPDAKQPVKVTTSGDLDEILFADTKTCPHLKQLFAQAARKCAELAKEPQHVALVERLKKIFTYVSPDYWSSRWSMIDIHDILTSLPAHGKKSPPGVTPVLLREVEKESVLYYRYWAAPSLDDELGHPIIQLTMGRLLDILVTNMEEAAAAHSTAASTAPAAVAGATPAQQTGIPPLRLFSGHDSTIFPLLVALGVDLKHWPPYISNLVFELWEEPASAETPSKPRYSVRVLYNKQEICLPGCKSGEALELGVFKDRVVGPFLLSDQARETACCVTLEHTAPMPQPASKSSLPAVEGRGA